MAAEDRALRAARQDIPRSLQRNELAAAADAFLAVPPALRGEFGALPEALRAKVAALSAQRAWVPLHGLAARAEKHPPLVADDATWWSLLVASAQQRDLARASRIWQRLRPSVSNEIARAAVDAWLSGQDSPAAVDALRAALPPEDPRLGEQSVTPRKALEAPRATEEVRPAVIRAFATQPFAAVASMLPGWSSRLTAEGRAALWEVAVPLALREMLRRLKGDDAGSAEAPLRLAVQGIEASNTDAMAPHRALIARYAMSALRGGLAGLSRAEGVAALRVPLGDPAFRDIILDALGGVDLAAVSDAEAPALCAALVKLAPRGAVLCAVLQRLISLAPVDEVVAAVPKILRGDPEGVTRWLLGAPTNVRRRVLATLSALDSTDACGDIVEAVWARADDHERERIVPVFLSALRRETRRMRFVFGPVHDAVVRATGVRKEAAMTLFEELYADLDESLADDLSCAEIDALIDGYSPLPMDRKTEAAWRSVAEKAHADYHAAQRVSLGATNSPRLARWGELGAVYDPTLLRVALRARRKEDAFALARDFAKRRKGIAPWIEAAVCCDQEGMKAVADKVLAEGLARFAGDLGALCAARTAPAFMDATTRHRRRVAEAVVAAADALRGRAPTETEALMIRWSRSIVTRAKAATEKRKATAAKKRGAKAVKR